MSEGLGLRLATPGDPQRRGAHVTFHHPQAWQICQALKAAGVIPDFRTPERLRIGLAPLYTRFIDVYEGMRRLRSIMTERRYEAFTADFARVT
jgi:kynureninase